MKKLMFKLAVATSVAFGAQAILAQEMGEEAPEETAAEEVAAEETAVEEESPAEAIAEYIAENNGKDEGIEIVEKEQEGQQAESITAEDAETAMTKWLAENGYSQTLDPERGCIIQMGVAQDLSIDPVDEDFTSKREMLYREAQLRAKIAIAGMIESQIDASNYKKGLDPDELKKFDQAHAQEINQYNEQYLKVKKMLVEADINSTASLVRNALKTDQVVADVNKVMGRLEYASNNGTLDDTDKKNYEKIKVEYDVAVGRKADLEEMRNREFPDSEQMAKIETIVRMKLHGVIPIHEIESYKNNRYQVAVAMIWSPKLQDRAAKMLTRQKVEGAKPTEDRTLSEYLNANAKELASMVGARQFVDKNGKLYFIGISSQDVDEENVIQDDKNKVMADKMAIQAVVASLFVEGNGYTKAQMKLFKYNLKEKGGDIEKVIVENMDESTAGLTSIGGLGKVYSTKQVHPITGKEIYISVAAIDSELAARAPAIKKMWDVQAVKTMRDMNYIKGLSQGAEDAFQEAKHSKVDFERGRTKARTEINEEVERLQNEENGVKKVKKVPAKKVKKTAKEGIFSGKAKHSDDF